MKKIILLGSCVIMALSLNAQESIDDLLAAGVADAQRFTSDYIAPASESVAYGINGGWFNNAKTPKQFGFELALIGNASFIKDEKKSFNMVAADYDNIRFQNSDPSRMVATSLGNNEPDVNIIITYADPIFGNQEVQLTLPTGLGAEGVNLVPTAFLQASFSPLKGTQIKGRYFPKINTDDVDLGMYGIGIQQDFTRMFPTHDIIPVAVSGLVAYTHLNGSYDFTDVNLVAGDNQQLETEVNTWLFQLIAGTKLKTINFYAALGYIKGDSTTDILGTYRVSDGLVVSQDIPIQ